MSEANKSLVRRWIEEAINKGNLNIVDEIIANDHVYREPTVEERRGKAAAGEVITMYRNAFPDIKLTIAESDLRGRQGRDADERQRNEVNCSGRHRPASA